jgi:predicted amidophosphoribosyltransferase
MATATLSPCPDCGHMLSRLAETCPSCARPLRKPGPREGLFLRNLNQLASLVFWGPVLFAIILFIAITGAYIVTRFD